MVGIFVFIWLVNLLNHAQIVDGFQPLKSLHHEILNVSSKPPYQDGYDYSNQSKPNRGTNLKFNSGYKENSFKLTKEHRKNLSTPNDVLIKTEGRKNLFIQDGQDNYKLPKHGEIFNLPFTFNNNDNRVPEKTEENLVLF